MAHGILGGIGLGAAFSVGVAGLVSVLVPLEPQRAPQAGVVDIPLSQSSQPATATVTATNDSESNVSQPQVRLRTPDGEELPNEPVAAAQPPNVATQAGEAAQSEVLETNPVSPFDTQTAALSPLPQPTTPSQPSATADPVALAPVAPPQPQTGVAGDLNTPRPLPERLRVRVEEDAPVLPNPQALAPMIPDDSQDGEVAQQSAPPQAPAADSEEVFVVVPPLAEAQTGEAQANEAQADEAPSDEAVIATAPDEEVQGEAPPVVIAQAPKPRVLPTPGTQRTTLGTSARPRIGTPANTLIKRTADDADPAAGEVVKQAPTVADVVSGTSPLRTYARPFDNAEGKPLMSIVLIDTGADLDAAAIGLPALSSFPYPVSFAVDVRLVDAAKRMERYRAEGFEVLAMVDLPRGARPSDAEVSLSVALNGMPEIVGVLEGTGEGLQGSREVADQVTGILKASGHGLVTQSKGLNSMPNLAVKDGVPAAPVFRDFDSEGQTARVIRRFLDQAAFKADQEGGVIMLGRLRPETIEALLVWGLADRAGSVALAPVSAVLLGQR